MSVLINGMKMPEKTYAYCMLIKDIDGSVQLHVCTKNSEEMSEWELFNLVPVPPHGRLIDADEMVASVKRQTEIMREIAKEVDKLKPIANSKELDDVDIVAIAETVEKGVLQEIANAPTILKAEVGE